MPRSVCHVLLHLLLFLAYLPYSSWACTQSDTAYINMTAKIVSVEDPKTPAHSKHLVAGTVKVLDGCRFRVTNMTLNPAGAATFWYAIPRNKTSGSGNVNGNGNGNGNSSLNETVQEAPELLARVIQFGLGTYNGQTIYFTLDREIEFADLDVLIIWSEYDRRAYGAFGVNGKVEDYYDIRGQKEANLAFDPMNPFGGAGTMGMAGAIWIAGLALFAWLLWPMIL